MQRSEVLLVMLLAISVMGLSSLVNGVAFGTGPAQMIFASATSTVTQTFTQPVAITLSRTNSTAVTVIHTNILSTTLTNTMTIPVTITKTLPLPPPFPPQVSLETIAITLTKTNAMTVTQENTQISLTAAQAYTLITIQTITFTASYLTRFSPIIDTMLATGQFDPWLMLVLGSILMVGVGLGYFLPFRKRTIMRETRVLVQGSGTPFAALSDIGKRAENEDSVAIEFTSKSGAIYDSRYSVVVADGVSGEAEGKTASSLAVNTILSFVESSGAHDEEALRTAFIEANRAIIDYSTSKLHGQKLASTAVAAVVSRNKLVLGNVGDSRGYLFRDGKLYQLTRDHTVAQQLVDERRISRAQAMYYPDRHTLTKALGHKADVDPVMGSYEVAKGDVLLCCSDGLTDGLTDTQIASVMQGVKDMQRLSDALVQHAKSAGSQDNITVALVRVD